MVERKIFATEFEPIVQIGEKVLLLPDDKCYEVKYIEPLPAIDKDFGAISAGTSTDQKEVNEIKLNRGELGQYRFLVITDNVRVEEFYITRGAKGWTTKTGAAKVPAFIDYGNSIVKNLQTTEIFQFESKYPKFITLHNYGPVDVPASIVRFYGFAFVIEEVEKEKPYLPVPLASRVALK